MTTCTSPQSLPHPAISKSSYANFTVYRDNTTLTRTADADAVAKNDPPKGA